MQVLKKGFTLMLGLAMILSTTVFAFAAEPAANEKVKLVVTVGDHGKVNDQTGVWTKEVARDEVVKLHVVADEGYAISSFKINGDEETSGSEIGKTTTDFEYQVVDNASIEFAFSKSSDTTQPSTPGTTDPGTQPSTPGTEQPTTGETFNFTWEVTNPDLGSVTQTIDPKLITASKGTVKYAATDAEDFRTIYIKANNGGNTIEKVVINGKEDTSFAGKTTEKYLLTTGDVDMKVTFKAASGDGSSSDETFKIDTKAGEHGNITASIPSYKAGEEQKIQWTSDAGYVIDTVKIDDVNKTEADNVGIGKYSGEVTFTTGNHTVEVTFKAETGTKTDTGDAGVLNLDYPANYKPGENVTIVFKFRPADTTVDTEYVLESSDFEIVSSDKGTVEGKTVKGVIAKGTEEEVITVVLKTTEVKNRITGTFTQNGKQTVGGVETIGYKDDSGEATDLTGGILGFTVDGEFYAYTDPEGQNDDYFMSMTMLSAKPDSVIKITIEKDGQYYDVAKMDLNGTDKESWTGQELYDGGNAVPTEGLEMYHCFTTGGQFDSKYTVPAELQPSGMQALITLSDEDGEIEDTDDETIVDNEDGIDSDSDSDSSNTSGKVVKTGDETNMTLYASAMFMSILLLGTLLMRRRVMNN